MKLQLQDGIKEALPYIDKLLEAFNIPKLYKDGYEQLEEHMR